MPLEQIIMKKLDTISMISFVNNLHKYALVELEMSCSVWNTMLKLIIRLIRNYFCYEVWEKLCSQEEDLVSSMVCYKYRSCKVNAFISNQLGQLQINHTIQTIHLCF